MNFEILKQKRGKGQTFTIKQRPHWTILNKDNLDLPI